MLASYCCNGIVRLSVLHLGRRRPVRSYFHWWSNGTRELGGAKQGWAKPATSSAPSQLFSAQLCVDIKTCPPNVFLRLTTCSNHASSLFPEFFSGFTWSERDCWSHGFFPNCQPPKCQLATKMSTPIILHIFVWQVMIGYTYNITNHNLSDCSTYTKFDYYQRSTLTLVTHNPGEYLSPNGVKRISITTN